LEIQRSCCVAKVASALLAVFALFVAADGPIHSKELMSSPGERQALIERVRSESIEMLGLRLTVSQAARLWGLDLDGLLERRSASPVLHWPKR
jgi:hypothetical protein